MFAGALDSDSPLYATPLPLNESVGGSCDPSVSPDGDEATTVGIMGGRGDLALP